MISDGLPVCRNSAQYNCNGTPQAALIAAKHTVLHYNGCIQTGKRTYVVSPVSPVCHRRMPHSGLQSGYRGPVAKPPRRRRQQQDQQSQTPAEDQSLQTFKAEVNVVNLFFNVKDKHGMLIPNLTKDDFEVFEDGKPQTIKYFSAESNQPLTLGIMIDTSASQTRVLDIEQEVLRRVPAQPFCAIKTWPSSSTSTSMSNLDQDFTNNVHDLTSALNKMQINAGMGGGPPGLGGGPGANHTARVRFCMTPSTWAPMRS